jgi:hypothetical protein
MCASRHFYNACQVSMNTIESFKKNPHRLKTCFLIRGKTSI